MLILKKISLIIILVLITIASAMVWAEIMRTLLVLDNLNHKELPRHFRSTANLALARNDINWMGMSSLRMAGGGQFSEMALQQILHVLGSDNVLIIDLRQESHGFIDGNAISWYGPHDAANAGKTPEQIIENQSKRLAKLDKMKKVKVHKILKKTPDEIIEKTIASIYSVRDVTSEADLVKKHHLDYERIFVQDFHPPSDSQVDRFIQIIKHKPENQWVYFHCRAGVGRTTTFMAMYDMMMNAKTVSLNDMLARQSALGGKDFHDLPGEDRWKYRFAVERLSFLKQFYAYARSNQDDFTTSWSAWVAAGNK